MFKLKAFTFRRQKKKKSKKQIVFLHDHTFSSMLSNTAIFKK